jgi:hypothetical protein
MEGRRERGAVRKEEAGGSTLKRRRGGVRDVPHILPWKFLFSTFCHNRIVPAIMRKEEGVRKEEHQEGGERA